MMMKIKVAILAFSLIFISSLASAQNWSVHGNLLSGSEFIGSTNSQSLKLATLGQTRMIIKADGAVGIGTVHTGSFRLSVDGKIRAREVYINLDSWADRVFDAEYGLLPLNDLQLFIENHRRLPNVPCEEEIIRSDVSIGDLQTLLLQKIEELTLYVLQLNRRLEELEEVKANN